MKSLRFLDRRVGYSVGAVSLLFATMAPALVPAFASASTITGRSIQMSSSAVSGSGAGTGVSYQVAFTPATTGLTDMIIYFCDNTPLSGSTCNAPAGLSVSSATVTAGTGTTGAALESSANDTGNPGGPSSAHNIIAITGMTLGTSASTLTINNVTNPNTVETFYARVQLYSSETVQRAAYTAGAADTSFTDSGSVALSTNNTLGVNAAVLESLTFCVFGDPGNVSNAGTANQVSNSSTYLGGVGTNVGTVNSNNLDDLGALTSTDVTNQAPGASCDDSSAATYAGGSYATAHSVPASVKLGQYVANNVYALDTGHISYATDWAQLSTNANGGANVYLQSANQCTGGGLSDQGAGSGATCGIPGETGTLTAGTAGFGVALGTPVNLDSVTTNDGGITLGASYNASGPKYALPTTTASTYGSSLFTTSGAPATNWDVPLGVGATISNETAAGNYSDNLNLVAVGTF